MKPLSALLVLLLSLAPHALASGSATIPLDSSVAGLLKLHATVAGHPGTFLFDSGSGVSSISPELAAAIGCHPWGQLTGFRMTGERLDMPHCDGVAITLGDSSFPAGTVGVFDLGKLLPPEVGHIDGVIALDLFANQPFTLSVGGRALRLLDPDALSHEIGGLRSVPVHLVHDAEGLALTINLPVSTAAGTAWFEMDSGNTSDLILVNKAVAPLFSLKLEGKDAASISLRLADGTTFTGQARVLPLILDGNLGSSFLRLHNVTVDPRQHLAWIRPRAADTHGGQ